MSRGRKHRQAGGVCPNARGPEENLRGGLGLWEWLKHILALITFLKIKAVCIWVSEGGICLPLPQTSKFKLLAPGCLHGQEKERDCPDHVPVVKLLVLSLRWAQCLSLVAGLCWCNCFLLFTSWNSSRPSVRSSTWVRAIASVSADWVVPPGGVCQWKTGCDPATWACSPETPLGCIKSSRDSRSREGILPFCSLWRSVSSSGILGTKQTWTSWSSSRGGPWEWSEAWKGFPVRAGWDTWGCSEETLLWCFSV